MRKSSRLWWLHGAILLSAVIGCKNTGGGGGGAPAGGPTMGGPITAGGPTMYQQGSVPSYSGAGSMPGGAGAFPSSTSSGYPQPGMSSTTPGLGVR